MTLFVDCIINNCYIISYKNNFIYFSHFLFFQSVEVSLIIPIQCNQFMDSLTRGSKFDNNGNNQPQMYISENNIQLEVKHVKLTSKR